MTVCPLAEYATVGYMAKRIQMRKNRFLAIQKLAEQKQKSLESHAGPGDPDHAPKQTVNNIITHTTYNITCVCPFRLETSLISYIKEDD